MSVRLKVYPFKRRDVIALMFNRCLGSNNSTACVLERGTRLTLTRETTKLVFDIGPAAKMTQNSAQTGGKKRRYQPLFHRLWSPVSLSSQPTDGQPLCMIGGVARGRRMRGRARHATSPSLSFSLTGPELR